MTEKFNQCSDLTAMSNGITAWRAVNDINDFLLLNGVQKSVKNNKNANLVF